MKCAIFMFGALLLACGDDTGPQGTGGTGAGPSIQYQDPDLPRLPTTNGKKRTVEQRNPFGNVEATRNLLWDGDFEWTSPFTDQYGWGELTGLSAQLLLSDVAVGAECRSGLKCARVAKHTDIFGLGVGSRNESLVVSVWAKFSPAAGEEAPPCDDAHVALVDIGELSMADPDATIPLEGEGADEQGWCHFSGVAPPRDHKPYLFVSNNSSKIPLLVDDVVMTAMTDGDAAPSPATTALEVPTERREHLEQMKSAVRAMPRMSDGRPNEAREAYERYMQHKRGAR